MKRIFVGFLAAALSVSFAGCTMYNYKPTQEVFTKPGAYTTTVKGHNGDVTVVTTVDKSRVKKIEVISHQESPSVGDVAMQKVVDSIIANQGFDVDIISGATYSSVAVLEAVSTAAKEAGADVEIITMEAVGAKSGGSEGLTTPKAPFTPGSYTASSKGYGGEITVTVELDAEKIVAVKADGPNETQGIGSNAIAQLPDKIVEANSVEIDGVSGATMSSNAIKSAVVAAMEQAK